MKNTISGRKLSGSKLSGSKYLELMGFEKVYRIYFFRNGF
ncbi:hypothetical protein MTBBW1_340005 [Desulfamplus magnetovallimortis]|uniref:Uncharacterized protein n=1 Tax=Desulfamplus magnetovallimortis TaxID=1246637 RepID=A0A1W1HGA7_9BACT|nr:hypothetical protein MTBBW1_340005 [Desulfamplus magnetovallimortis]